MKLTKRIKNSLVDFIFNSSLKEELEKGFIKKQYRIDFYLRQRGRVYISEVSPQRALEKADFNF
jgi:hypothetical protein